MEETRVVVETFLAGHAGHWLAEDAGLCDPAEPHDTTMAAAWRAA